ncbi:hypothetical protein [Azovibrio restrictus]|uniref:hypothetical protein n=1 Tax=Azovibrio restrictus TaxID=146938 RepID=UPI0026EFC9CA|nr:hypothetical protein [Azovibrio restrictus]
MSVLPGIPQAVALRPDEGARGNGEPYVRAFLLPGVEAINAPPSLVIPTGIYRAERPASLATEEAIQPVVLKHLLERGPDFDRVSYELRR